MKVGIYCDSFFPENKAVAVRLFHLAQGFTQQPATTVVVHTSTRAKTTLPPAVSVVTNLVPAPSNESSNVVRLLSEFALGIETFFRILFCGYRVIVISSPPFFSSFFGVIAAWLRGIPYVLDIRDEYPEVYFTAGLLREQSVPGKILLSFERFMYRKSLMVITVTEGICRRIDRKVGIPGFTVLVRNGFDETMFAPSSSKREKFTVVFHGNIGKFQDPRLIISLAAKAFKRNPGIEFLVIGWGNNDDSLRSETPPNLTYMGAVNYRDIPAIIATAHLGISFRTNDPISVNSFPVKLYEYVGVGLPVIVTPVSEAGDFFQKNGIGFQFDSSQEDEILAKILELAQDAATLKALGQRVVSLRNTFSRQQISNTFAQKVVHSLSARHG